jgi:hypothetical protein
VAVGTRTKGEKWPTVVENNFVSYEAITGEEESRWHNFCGGIEEGGLALRSSFLDSMESIARWLTKRRFSLGMTRGRKRLGWAEMLGTWAAFGRLVVGLTVKK